MSYDSEWDKVQAAWKLENPPDHAGYWYCFIGGGALSDGQHDAMGGYTFNLGHDISRARSSAQKYDTTRCKPVCPFHNRQQGSLTFDEFRAKNPSKRCGM